MTLFVFLAFNFLKLVKNKMLSWHGIHWNTCYSFSTSVGLYSANEDEALFLLREHKGGITHLQFSSDGFYLFSGARKVKLSYEILKNLS